MCQQKKKGIMGKSVLNSVRQAIDCDTERAQERVKSAREEIVNLPDLLRGRRQLKRWQKRAKTLRQSDFTFVIMLFPSMDSLDSSGELPGQSVFLKSKGKLQAVLAEAFRRFCKKNEKNKINFFIRFLIGFLSLKFKGLY
jgi:hypothetical protein